MSVERPRRPDRSTGRVSAEKGLARSMIVSCRHLHPIASLLRPQWHWPATSQSPSEAPCREERRRRRWSVRAWRRVLASAPPRSPTWRLDAAPRWMSMRASRWRSGSRSTSGSRADSDVPPARRATWCTRRWAKLEARLLRAHDYEVAIDHPYQHYQFAGRADVLAWTRTPAALLHIENRTRFPDLQAGGGQLQRQAPVPRWQRGSPARHPALRVGDARDGGSLVGRGHPQHPPPQRYVQRPLSRTPTTGCGPGCRVLRRGPARARPSCSWTRSPSGPARASSGWMACSPGARPRLRDYRDAAERLGSPRRA